MLISRNIKIAGKRTSMRLEPEVWQALAEISQREQKSVHDICTEASASSPTEEASRTSAVRVFVLEYFRQGLKAYARM